MSYPVSILSLATQTPPHELHQDVAVEVAREVMAGNFRDFERMTSVFTNAGIQQRQLARPVDWYRTERTFAERTAVYLDTGLDLFIAAATRALAEAGLSADMVDTIVTVSSTGIATPSLEARALGPMGFRTDVARVPVFGLGCAGGVSGLGLAAKLARAAPGSTVLFVTVELCSLAFQTGNVGKADVISVALFGDGAAACVIKAGDEGFVQITGSGEKIWPDTLDIMGWDIKPEGLGVVLNRAIPTFARDHMRAATEEISSGANKDWEIQASQFSAEMLMPAPLVKARLVRLKDPELAHVLTLRDEFETSMEMTARRVVELNEYPCAVVFSKDNVVRYSVWSSYFSRRLCVKKGDKLPAKSLARGAASDPDEWHELDACWWLTEQPGADDQPESVYEQTFVQENGFKVTMVIYEAE